MTDNILIVTSTPAPGREDDLSDYVSKVMPLLMAAGGELLNRYKVSENISAERRYSTVMLMRFENSATIRDLFASDSYAALIPIRDRAFSNIDISIGDDAF